MAPIVKSLPSYIKDSEHASSGMRNLRTLFDLASDWLMEKWSVLIGREKISRD